MVDTVRKGKRIESLCAAELREKGLNVWQAIRVKYRNIDLWQLFDIAAQDPKTGKVLLIQCKTNRVRREVREAIRGFKVAPGIEKQIWCWYDRKGFVKEIII